MRAKPEHGDYGWAGASPNLPGRGCLRAIDFATGKVRGTALFAFTMPSR
jgi:hypothetical protein